MANLNQSIARHSTVSAFRRIGGTGDDPRGWEFAPEPGDVVANADHNDFYVLGALHIVSTTDVRRCYMDISTPERINDYAYFVDGCDLHFDYTFKFGGDIIPEIAIDCFGAYELYYSRIAPELGIDVLRRGLKASGRKCFIAEDLGYILRDEGHFRESAEMFELAAHEGPSSYFIYGELAELYRKIGETEKHKEYAELFERCEHRQA